jgi:hypothetical protein
VKLIHKKVILQQYFKCATFDDVGHLVVGRLMLWDV